VFEGLLDGGRGKSGKSFSFPRGLLLDDESLK
jgi:hypothetical protein